MMGFVNNQNIPPCCQRLLRPRLVVDEKIQSTQYKLLFQKRMGRAS